MHPAASPSSFGASLLARVAAIVLGLGVVGCAKIPAGRSAIDAVEVHGNESLDDDEIRDRIATSPSPKFFFLARGVYDYELFDRYVLQRDLERLERFYRARGFYDAHARAARVFTTAENHVDVEIVVEEGTPVNVRGVRVEGIEKLSVFDRALANTAALKVMRPGERFDEEAFEKGEAEIKRALGERSYAWAQVQRDASVDVVTHSADVVYSVVTGERAHLGPITIQGLGPIPEEPVRRALDLQEGEAYSVSDLEAAQQAVLDLGVFSSVEIRPQLPMPPPADHVVPVQVVVEPTRLRSVRIGPGFELDVIKTDLHLTARWEHKNLFGGLRSFMVEFKPGVVLYPTRIPTFHAPDRLLPEEKLRAEFRRPGFLEARTTGFIRPEFNVYPVLLRTKGDENEPILGYIELKTTTGVDRTFGPLYAALSHSVQVNDPFAYRPPIRPDIDTIVISYPELLTNFDFRDDPRKTKRGFFLGNTLQIAGLGGQPRDVKVQPEVRGYVPFFRKKFVLAARASVGFLLAQNYGSSLENLDEQNSGTTRDRQLMFFRGFFSGGPSSNRGYPLRGVGPHAVASFYDPNLDAVQFARECPEGSQDINCRVPVGGPSLWELSLEGRFPIAGPLTGAAFCDASDVSSREFYLRFNRPHLSCGLGARYDTPVGPIRLDLGYRLPGLQVLGYGPSKPLPADEGIQPELVDGVPMALHLGIGEAF